MIFYADDWKFYPNAIADLDTANTTWVRYAALLEKMGVKNNLFHLSLLDKDLVGVNPHDPDLDDDIKIKIVKEVSNNIWYFFREVITIPTTGSVDNAPYGLNRLNAAFHWLYTQNISAFVTGVRQAGKSLCADVQHIAYLDVYCRNYPIDVIVNSSQLRSSSTEKRINLRKAIPDYLSYRTPKGMKLDRENTEIIECKRLGNVIRCQLASDREDKATSIGRGLTSATRQIDEGPYCRNIDISLSAAEMGGIAAIRAAKENGTPYGTIITTTPGDLTSKEGLFMYKIFTSAMPWTEQLYDCKNREEVMKIITMQTSGSSEMVNITMYHNNLGLGNDWLAAEILRVRANSSDIEKDMLLEWDKGSMASPLSKETLFRINENERDPVFTEINEYHYLMRWYINKDEVDKRLNSGNYVLSLDPSELAGRDMHGLTLTNVEDMSIIMVCSPNEGNTFTFAKWLFNFLIKYPKILFVAEAKSTGRSLIDTLIVLFVGANINPFKRIYSNVFEKPDLLSKHDRLIYSNEARGTIEEYSSLKKCFGITTTEKIRDTLYNNLLITIGDDFGHNIRDRELSKQIRQLVIVKGRIDHPTNGRDDLVISWLLTAYVLRMSPNLFYYGILPRTILRGKYISNEDIGKDNKNKLSYEEEQIQKYKQNRLKLDLEMLINKYKDSNDITEQSVLEYRLKNIYSKIKSEEMDITSFDGIISSIKQETSNSKLINYHRKQKFINDIFEKFGR